MLGINSLSLNTSSIVDCYNVVNDKKNDTIATVIANRRSNKDRASATMIGAILGLAQSLAFAGTYAGAKMFPKLQKFFPIKWAVNKVDEWIKIAQKNSPKASKLDNIMVGVISKSIYLIGSCALTGFAFDLYNNIMDTKLNGKFSNIKQGAQQDSWLLSGLKSMAVTSEGKKAIRNSMKAVDGGVVIKLKGVNKEYSVTNKEIKQASREYLTSFSEDGKVKGYKKNYSSGDGDVLAFEIAFKKYQDDLKNGRIMANKDLPRYANQFSSKGNLSETELSQCYYFLTGNKPVEISNDKSSNEQVEKLDKFLSDFSKNSDNMASGFTFKNDKKGVTNVKTILNMNANLSTDKTYAIKKVSDKYVTFVDARNTAVDIKMPIAEFKEKFDKLYVVNYKENN